MQSEIETMDDIDGKILELLTENSRMSFSEIARYFGFSDVAIRKRVDKLVDKGIIKRFTTVVDHKKLGKQVSAFVFFKTRSDKTQEVAEQLVSIDGVYDIYIALGVYDIITRVHCRDVGELRELTEERFNNINGILEVRPSIVFTEVTKPEEKEVAAAKSE
jgi:DNA-binding Lrp family transcriptional regulator